MSDANVAKVNDVNGSWHYSDRNYEVFCLAPRTQYDDSVSGLEAIEVINRKMTNLSQFGRKYVEFDS